VLVLDVVGALVARIFDAVDQGVGGGVHIIIVVDGDTKKSPLFMRV